MEDRTLVVIPTYQERANVEVVLERVRAAAPGADVLVVDDNSPDGTAAAAEAVAVRLGRISVLRRPGKGGLGSAYRAGFAWGRARGYDVFVEMDADLSHDPRAIPALLREIDRGADLAIGSRYVHGGATPTWPPMRRLLSRAGNLYARVLLGLTTTDATSGYRAYTRRALEAVDVDSTHASGYGFQIELTYRIVRADGQVREVPIVFRDRSFGTSKMSARIAVEALALVTRWAWRDRVLRRGTHFASLRRVPTAPTTTPEVRAAA